MEILKQTMLDTATLLEEMAGFLAENKLLSENEFYTVRIALNKLAEEQTRCVNDLSAKTGCAPEAGEQEEQEALPTAELPRMIVEESQKQTKEASFLSLWRKGPAESSTALLSVAYCILDEWGCRPSFLHAKFDETHAPALIDKVIAQLQKEGIIASYRLEGESGDDSFLNVTRSGFQILNKDSFMRKVNGPQKSYGHAKTPDVGVFVRLRRVNDMYAYCRKLHDTDLSRSLEQGFSGLKITRKEDISTRIYICRSAVQKWIP